MDDAGAVMTGTELKILQSVIGAIAVDVMHSFVSIQRTTQVACHDEAVF